MRAQTSHWTVAVALSAVIHGGAAVWFTSHSEDVQIAGGASVEVALLGNAPVDSVSAGHATTAVQPVTAETTPAKPVTTEAVRPAPVEPQRPAEIMAAAKPVTEQAEQAKPVEPQKTVEQPPAQPVPVEAVEAAEAEMLKPSEVEPVQAQEPEPVEAAKPAEAEPVEIPRSAPVPTPRPQRLAAVEKPQPAPQPKPDPKPKEKKPPAPKPEAAGSGGKGGPDSRRGTADGQQAGRAEATGKTGPAREAGNAAVSNYPGQVVSRLRRNLRYPPAARRQHLRGEVRVSFTVSSSGSVSAIGLAASSGSPVLDQAALETVRRAAPFPPIPAGAGRSSWSFTVPLAFTR